MKTTRSWYKKAATLAAFAFAAAFGLTAAAATIYVATTGDDTNGDGSQAAPYATLTKGLAVANDGDTIHMLAGTYDGAGYSIAKSVTIEGDVQGGAPVAKLNNTSGGASTETIDIGAADLTVVITNMAFISAGGGSHHAVHMCSKTGCSVSILGCTISDGMQYTTAGAPSGSSFVVDGCTIVARDGSAVSLCGNVTYRNNKISNVSNSTPVDGFPRETITFESNEWHIASGYADTHKAWARMGTTDKLVIDEGSTVVIKMSNRSGSQDTFDDAYPFRAQIVSAGTLTISGANTLPISGALSTTGSGTISITGGTYTYDPSTYVASGYEAIANGTSPETWTVQLYQPKVAQVISSDGTTTNGYATLAEAVTALNSAAGQTLTLLADAEVTAALTISKSATIDLNGFTLTSSAGAIAVSPGVGSLTLKNGDIVGGAGAIVYGSTGDASAITGKIVLDNVDISATGGDAIAFYAYRGAIELADNSTNTVTATSSGCDGLYVDCYYYNQTSISGSGSLTISGAYCGIHLRYSIPYLSAANLKTSGGTAGFKLDGTGSGGVVRGITAGLFSNDVSANTADEYICISNTDEETKAAYPFKVCSASDFNVTVKTSAGTLPYDTLSAAVAAVGSTEATISINKNLSENLVIAEGQNIVLTGSATLTGTITAPAGTLTIQGGSYTADPTDWLDYGLEASEESGVYTVQTRQLEADAEGVFHILTLDDLAAFRSMVNDGEDFADATVSLDANIDMSPIAKWYPIGMGSVDFAGTFEGNNWKLSGMTVVGVDGVTGGLFKNLGSGSVVRNLWFDGATVSGSKAGTLAGYAGSGSVVDGIIVKANCTVTGTTYAGGIIAEESDGDIYNCWNYATVTSDFIAAGISGFVWGEESDRCQVTNCVNKGTITGANRAGGIVAHANYADVSWCYNTGAVSHPSGTGGMPVGGIAAVASYKSTFKYCLNTGSVSGIGKDSNGSACGILGHFPSGSSYGVTISYCDNCGDITCAGYNAGGIGLSMYGGFTMSYCRNGGSVTAEGNVAGGISADTGSSTTLNCLNAGTLTGSTAQNFSGKNTGGYYYDGDTLKTAAGVATTAEAALADLNNDGAELDFWTTDANGKIITILTVPDDPQILVARIVETGKGYATLKDAINAVPAEGATIQLLVDELPDQLQNCSDKNPFTLRGKEGGYTKIPGGGNIGGWVEKNITFENIEWTDTLLHRVMSNVTFKGCKFTAKKATSAFSGGDAACGIKDWSTNGGHISFENCSFEAEGNYAFHFGYASDTGSVSFTNCYIGGLASSTAQGGGFTFDNCVIDVGLNADAGISLNGSPAVYNNCRFTEAALAVEGVRPNALTELNNCIVVADKTSKEAVAGKSAIDIISVKKMGTAGFVAVDAVKDKDTGKYVTGEFIGGKASNVSSYVKDAADLTWFSDDCGKMVYDNSGDKLAVTAIGTLTGTLRVPSGTDFTINNKYATFAEGTKFYLPYAQGGAEYNAWVTANIPAEQAENVTVAGWVAAIGATGYYTLQEALKAVKTDETIDLLADVTETSFTLKDRITLDAHDKNLNTTSGWTLQNGSVLKANTITNGTDLTAMAKGGTVNGTIYASSGTLDLRGVDLRVKGEPAIFGGTAESPATLGTLKATRVFFGDIYDGGGNQTITNIVLENCTTAYRAALGVYYDTLTVDTVSVNAVEGWYWDQQYQNYNYQMYTGFGGTLVIKKSLTSGEYMNAGYSIGGTGVTILEPGAAINCLDFQNTGNNASGTTAEQAAANIANGIVNVNGAEATLNAAALNNHAITTFGTVNLTSHPVHTTANGGLFSVNYGTGAVLTIGQLNFLNKAGDATKNQMRAGDNAVTTIGGLSTNPDVGADFYVTQTSDTTINKDGGNAVQFTGDIVFTTYADASSAGAKFTLNLDSGDDSFIGAVRGTTSAGNRWGKWGSAVNGDEVAGTDNIAGMTLTVTNGAVWNMTGDSAVNALTVKGSTLNGAGSALLIPEGGTFALDYTAAVSLGSIDNDGTITVDLAGATAKTYTIIKITSAEEKTLEDFGTVELVNSSDYHLEVVGNDLCAVFSPAQVISEDGATTNKYARLQLAFDAVQANETIEVLEDNTETITVTNTCAFAFKSNGHTLGAAPTCAAGYAFKVNGDGTCNYGKALAQIGSTKYLSLADAVAAVPTDGEEATTITMLEDETMAEEATISIVNKNVMLDLNGKTVSGSGDAKTKSFYFFNIGAGANVVITDSSYDESGVITMTPTAVDSGYGKESCTIYNCGGTLTLRAGKVVNNASTGLAYAINNSSNAWADPVASTFNMLGGTVSAPNGDGALRVYVNAGQQVSVNNVNIAAGTILDKGIFVDSHSYQALSDNMTCLIDITGGTINGLIDLKLRNEAVTMNISGGTFGNCSLNVRNKTGETLISKLTKPSMNISGGTFAFADGGAFQSSGWDEGTAPAYNVTGGMFSADPSAYVSAGYQVVDNADPVYKFAVGVKVNGGGETKATAVTEEQKYTVDEEKLEEVVTDVEVQVGIAQSTEVIGVVLTTEAETNAQGIVITPAGIQAVVDSAIDSGSEEFTNALASASVITVQVDVVVTPLQYVPTNETTKAGVIAFNLKPEATVTVTSTQGSETTSLSNKVEVTNEMIDQTRNIVVSIYTGFMPERIVHTTDDGSEVIETFGPTDFLYADGVATMTISHFSKLTAFQKPYVAFIGTNGYETLEAAVAAQQTGGGTIIVTGDVTQLTPPAGYHFETDGTNWYLVRDTMVQTSWEWVKVDNTYIGDGKTYPAATQQNVTLPAAWGVTPEGDVTVTVKRTDQATPTTVAQETIDGDETSWTFDTSDLAPGTYTVEAAWTVKEGEETKAEKVTATYKLSQLVDGSWEFVMIDNRYIGGKDYPAAVEQNLNLPAAWDELPDGNVLVTVTGNGKTISQESLDGEQTVWSFNTDDLAPGTYTVSASWTTDGQERSESATYKISLLVDGSWEFVMIDNRHAEDKTYPADTKQDLSLPAAWGLEPTDDVIVTLKDEDGNVIRSESVDKDALSWELDTKSLMPGKYTVSMTWNDGITTRTETVDYGIEILASGECLLDIDNRITELKRLAKGSEEIVLPASWSEDPIDEMTLTITDPDGVVTTKRFGSGDLRWAWNTMPLMPGTYKMSVDGNGSTNSVIYVIESLATDSIQDADLDNLVESNGVRLASNHSMDFNMKWVGATNAVLSLDGTKLDAEPDANGMWKWNTNGLGMAVYTFTNVVDGLAHEAKFFIDASFIKAIVDKGLRVTMSLDAYVEKFGAITNYSAAAISAPLMATNSNSMKVWQNYVAGLDGLVPLTPGCLPANVGSAEVTVVTPIDFTLVAPPADSGVTVSYQLVKSATTDFKDATVYATASTPVFKVNTSAIDAKTYWKIRAVFSGSNK